MKMCFSVFHLKQFIHVTWHCSYMSKKRANWCSDIAMIVASSHHGGNKSSFEHCICARAHTRMHARTHAHQGM